MRKLYFMILCALLLHGCAILNKPDSATIYRENQEKKLQTAVRLQNEGKIALAVESLKAICADKGLPGVTDEALFRLGMLYLSSGLDKDKEYLQLSQQNIDRLIKEYPSSSWTGMAVSIVDLLANSAELRRQFSNTKNQNQALTRENQNLSRENQNLSKENQELKESIEKLKRLDLELDKKRK